MASRESQDKGCDIWPGGWGKEQNHDKQSDHSAPGAQQVLIHQNTTQTGCRKRRRRAN